MAAKAKVVLTDYVWESLEVEKQTLAGLADLVPLQTKQPADFLAAAKDCDALLNTYAGPITADVMAQMPRCKIIARYGIGVDTIDLDAATQAGIIVTNNPTYCIEEVAEHTLALLLAAARKIAFYDRMVRAGRWEVPPGKPLFRLAGSTLGLVGFGNIARQVAVRAAAFGMRVLFADPYVKAGQFGEPGEKMELPALLAAADYISLHPPLVPRQQEPQDPDLGLKHHRLERRRRGHPIGGANPGHREEPARVMHQLPLTQRPLAELTKPDPPHLEATSLALFGPPLRNLAARRARLVAGITLASHGDRR